MRELAFLVEPNGYAWIKNMRRFLRQICAQVSRHLHKQLTEREYGALQKRYRALLTHMGRELPPIPERQNGQRCRVAKNVETP